jgi:hypothetical protein
VAFGGRGLYKRGTAVINGRYKYRFSLTYEINRPHKYTINIFEYYSCSYQDVLNSVV